MPILDWKSRIWLALIIVLALLFGAGAGYVMGGMQVEMDRQSIPRLELELGAARDRIDALKRESAIAQRSAQVTSEANETLRDELSRLEDTVAGLTADVEFYRRLLGTGGSQDGLAVHALQLSPTSSDRVFRFQLTLSQNLKRARVVSGRARLFAEGVREGSMQSLELQVQPDNEALDYEFKYFQQLEGSIGLPADFTLERIEVRLVPEKGRKTVSRTFEWAELAQGQESSSPDAQSPDTQE